MGRDDPLDAVDEEPGEWDRPGIVRLGQHVLERRAHRGQRQGIARQRAADAARVRFVGADGGGDPAGELGRQAVRGRRNPPADRLPDREHVGSEAVRAGVSARPGGDRVGLVQDQERPGPPASVPEEPRGSPAPGGRCRRSSAPAPRARRRRRPAPGRASRAGTSLNSTTRVVIAGSTGGPRLPDRAAARPSRSVMKLSSTVPW